MDIPQPIAFDWDAGNREKNWIKHTVHYKDIEEVFFSTPLIMYEDIKHSTVEKRYLALGTTNDGKHLTVVFIIRRKLIRVISARKQHRKEKVLYAKKS